MLPLTYIISIIWKRFLKKSAELIFHSVVLTAIKITIINILSSWTTNVIFFLWNSQKQMKTVQRKKIHVLTYSSAGSCHSAGWVRTAPPCLSPRPTSPVQRGVTGHYPGPRHCCLPLSCPCVASRSSQRCNAWWASAELTPMRAPITDYTDIHICFIISLTSPVPSNCTLWL